MHFMTICRLVFRRRNRVCYVVEQSTDLIGHVQCRCDMLTERTWRSIKSRLSTALDLTGSRGLGTEHYSVGNFTFDFCCHHVCTLYSSLFLLLKPGVSLLLVASPVWCGLTRFDEIYSYSHFRPFTLSCPIYVNVYSLAPMPMV